MAKLYASEVAVKICDEGVQLHGGYGFIKDYPAEKFYRDVKLCTIGEGTSEIQRLVIAREVLKQILNSVQWLCRLGSEARLFHQIADGDQAGREKNQNMYGIDVGQQACLLQHHVVNLSSGMPGCIGCGISSLLQGAGEAMLHRQIFG